MSDPPPPTLPPRPGARVPKPVPVQDFQEPDLEYADCEEANGFMHGPDEVYDDCDENPPPVPQHPEEFYDDVGEASPPPPPLPQRPQAARPAEMPLAAPQEFYDDIGPIVQTIPKRQGPSPPVHSPPAHTATSPTTDSVYELEDGDDGVDFQRQSSLPAPPSPLQEDPGAIYEVEPEVGDAAPALPPPPLAAPQLPAKSPSGPPKLPPHPSKPVTSPGPKAKAPPGGVAMDLNMIQNAMKGLRKVSIDGGNTTPTDSNHDPKVYDEFEGSVQDFKKKFESKAEGKPEILSPKPQVGASKGPKPAPTTNRNKGTAHGSPGVPNSARHSGSPLPSPSTPKEPVTPVSKFQPKQEVFDEPDEIYDDASSAPLDPLMHYDWYHGRSDRSVSDQKLKAVGKDGTFLVRVSTKDPETYPFTLAVFHNGQVNNLRIRKRTDGKVALGDEKTGEVAFKDVPAMIDHHRKHNVVLLGNNQSQVKLQTPAPKH